MKTVIGETINEPAKNFLESAINVGKFILNRLGPNNEGWASLADQVTQGE